MIGNVIVRTSPGAEPVSNGDLMRGGIYVIAHIASGKAYVGSAVNFKRRFNSHRSSLALNKHHSGKLQNAWNKYGESAFSFSIIEVVPEARDLVAREQAWIDEMDSVARGYNISPTAGSPLGVKHSAETCAKVSIRLVGNKHALGLKHSDETKAKIAAKSRGRAPFAGHVHSDKSRLAMSLKRAGVSLTEEHCAKIGAAHKGKKYSDERRKQIGDVQRRFTPDQANSIRNLIGANLSYSEIAGAFQCSRQVICDINLRKWAYRDW